VPVGLAPERLIDHTNLKADATRADVERLCDEALEHDFAAVCVNAVWVELCAKRLAGSSTRVATVAGFPLGAALPEVKAYEAARAIERGAREIDMVINIGALLDADEKAVADDIRAVREACGDAKRCLDEARGFVAVSVSGGIVLKVIIETCYLKDAQKRTACRIALREGADFVKTSTGLGPGGATADDVKLMRRVVGPEMGVKAAGGIRDAATFWTMVRAGANRIGTSAAVAIMREISEGRTT
jgi:deoxyribose-phosphate aldolase